MELISGLQGARRGVQAFTYYTLERVKALKELPHLALLPVWSVSKNCRQTVPGRTILGSGGSYHNVTAIHTNGGDEPIQGFPPGPKTQV